MSPPGWRKRNGWVSISPYPLLVLCIILGAYMGEVSAQSSPSPTRVPMGSGGHSAPGHSAHPPHSAAAHPTDRKGHPGSEVIAESLPLPDPSSTPHSFPYHHSKDHNGKSRPAALEADLEEEEAEAELIARTTELTYTDGSHIFVIVTLVTGALNLLCAIYVLRYASPSHGRNPTPSSPSSLASGGIVGNRRSRALSAMINLAADGPWRWSSMSRHPEETDALSKPSANPKNDQHRFAFYTCTTDTALSLLLCSSALYVAINHQLMPLVWCKAVGFSCYALVSMDLALVMFDAISTWWMACLGTGMAGVPHPESLVKPPRRFGRFDWKVFCVCAISPWILSGVLEGFDAFGPDEYWCFVNGETTSGKIALVATTGLHYVALVVVLLTHIPIIHASQRQGIAVVALDKEKDELRTLRLHHDHPDAETTASHLLIHCLHYTPGTIHFVSQIAGYERAWVYIIAVIFAQLGAVGHAGIIGYCKWRDQPPKSSKVQPSPCHSPSSSPAPNSGFGKGIEEVARA
ncbi:hypothetical protein BJ684DRAFT_14327 [Piptocephalis cylindrospora]|uniref:Uncharacterized protein n=1 Tax=Piptocephalis cylindrospora TaxID=1907219 RepID=A0A4V1IYQ9_9FUNG|nr:hypothetical protein BJ684DRAFT_14327 [Piptocephalis cylindrospora]|eukprot:RKP15419.1 hypothetical protein BJ684DRAFT_14327 [Piptocephalis cylindrospora]